MLSGPSSFYTVLANVRDACVTALRNAGNQPSRVGIVPGAIAWDECDQCGLLALASTRNYLSDDFPADASFVTRQPGAILCADVVVQIIRCAPEPQGSDASPSVVALDASAQLVNADAYAVMCATIDTLTTMLVAGDIDDFLMRQQTFMGPSGACVGSELGFVVGVIR